MRYVWAVDVDQQLVHHCQLDSSEEVCSRVSFARAWVRQVSNETSTNVLFSFLPLGLFSFHFFAAGVLVHCSVWTRFP